MANNKQYTLEAVSETLEFGKIGGVITYTGNGESGGFDIQVPNISGDLERSNIKITDAVEDYHAVNKHILDTTISVLSGDIIDISGDTEFLINSSINISGDLLELSGTVEDHLENHPEGGGSEIDDLIISGETAWSSLKINSMLGSTTGGGSGVPSYEMANGTKIIESLSEYVIPSLSGDVDYNKQFIIVDALAIDDRTSRADLPVEGRKDFSEPLNRICKIILPLASEVLNKIYTITNREILIKEDESWSVEVESQNNNKIYGLDNSTSTSFSSRLSIGGPGASIQVISDGENWVVINKFGGVYCEGGAEEVDVCFLGDNAGLHWDKWKCTFECTKHIYTNVFLSTGFNTTTVLPTLAIKTLDISFNDIDLSSAPMYSIIAVQNTDLSYSIWSYKSTDPFLVRVFESSTAKFWRHFTVNNFPTIDAPGTSNWCYIMYESVSGDMDSWECWQKRILNNAWHWIKITDEDKYLQFQRCDDLVLIGHSSGVYNSGQAVISIGEDNCIKNSGNHIISIGEDTCFQNSTKHGIYIGDWSGFNAGDYRESILQEYNIGLGDHACHEIIGSDNIGIGHNANFNKNKALYDNCICIGKDTGYRNETSGKLLIGIVDDNSSQASIEADVLLNGQMTGEKYLNINGNTIVNGQIYSNNISNTTPSTNTADSVIDIIVYNWRTHFEQSVVEYANKFPIGSIICLDLGNTEEYVKVTHHSDSSQRSYIIRDILNTFSGALPQHEIGVTLTQMNIIDFNLGNIHDIDLTGLSNNVDLKFVNEKLGASYIIKITQATGTHVDVILPSNIKWVSGTAFETTKADGAEDIIQLIYDGTNYFGNIGLNYS